MLSKFVSLMTSVESPKAKQGENAEGTDNVEVNSHNGTDFGDLKDGQSQSETPTDKRAGSKQSTGGKSPRGKSPKKLMTTKEEPEEKPRFKQEHQIRNKHKIQQREEDLRQMRDRLS